MGGANYVMPKHGLAGADVSKILEHLHARKPIGAGPYRLSEAGPGQHDLRRVPEHWAGKPSIDRLVLRLIPEPATVMAELRAGNVDAGQILPDEFEAFQREGRQQVLRLPGDASFWFSFNHAHPLLRDVRAAGHLPCRRPRPDGGRSSGHGRVVNSPVHPSLWQHNPALVGYAYDPNRPALLSDAGFTTGPGGAPARGPPASRQVRLPLREALPGPGADDPAVPATGRHRDHARSDGARGLLRSVFTVANRDNLEMVGLAWFNLVYPTQVSWKRTSAAPARPRGSSSTPTRRSTNCLTQANTAPDAEALKTIYFRVQDIILRDVPRVMTFRPDELWAVQRRFILPKTGSLADLFRSIPQWKVQ